MADVNFGGDFDDSSDSSDFEDHSARRRGVSRGRTGGERARRQTPAASASEALVEEPKVSKTARLTAELTAIAAYLIESKALVLSDAFTTPGQGFKWWFHDGTKWLLPFAPGAQVQALVRVLAKAKRDGKLTIDESPTKTYVTKLLAAAEELDASGEATAEVLTTNDVIAMRKRARTMLAFRNGIVDLGDTTAVVRRPIPRDALFFSDEIADAELPATDAEFWAISTEQLEDVLEAILCEPWVVFFDAVVDAFRCTPSKTQGGGSKSLILFFSAARSTFKSAVVAILLGSALPPARCPAPYIPAFMIGPKFSTNEHSDLAPTRLEMKRNYGRSIIRYFDEVDNNKKQIDMTAVKSEQTPYGSLKIEGADGEVQVSSAPLYIASTNKSPESVFLETPSEEESQYIFVLDTRHNLFARDVDKLDETGKARREALTAWLLNLERHAPPEVKKSLSLQVARLAAGWLLPERAAERQSAAELRSTLTLKEHRARKAEEQIAENRRLNEEVDAHGAIEADNLLSCFQAWLGQNEHRWRCVCVHGWSGADCGVAPSPPPPSPPLPPPSPPPPPPVLFNTAWARYNASSWSQESLTWLDASGNGRTATATAGVALTSLLGGGASGSVASVSGMGAEQVNFRWTFPPVFSACTLSRALSTTAGRVLSGPASTNWYNWGHDCAGSTLVSGFHAPTMAAATWGNAPSYGVLANKTDWLWLCATNDASSCITLLNGRNYCTTAGFSADTLLAGGFGSCGSPQWAVAEVTVWDRPLSLAEFDTINAYFVTTYGLTNSLA